MDSSPTTGGAPAAHCAACGARLDEGAAFCHRCGAERGAPISKRGVSAALPLSVAAFALVALLALVASQFFGKRSTVAPAPEATASAPVDISSMSPEEQANRLFNRVMQYSSDGKTDSAKFFAPMAIAALEALAPLSIHQRYDLGLIGLASGDAELARAESDTILRAQPAHLLGLILGSRAADARGATAARTGFDKRLLAAAAAERARGLPEYQDHDPDIRAAIKSAQERSR